MPAVPFSTNAFPSDVEDDKEELQSLVSSSVTTKPIPTPAARGRKPRKPRRRFFLFVALILILAELYDVLISRPLDLPNAFSSRTSSPIDDDRKPGSQCFLGYEPPNDRASRIVELRANLTGIGDCDPENLTSLKETAKLFATLEPTVHRDEPFAGIEMVFHARTARGEPQTIGGDEFVVVFSGWSQKFAFKTALIANDLGNGTYGLTIRIPNVRLESFNVSVSHYYTCYQGFAITQEGKNAFSLDFGPQFVETASRLSYALVESEQLGNLSQFEQDLKQLPECDASQEGVNQLSNGLWMDRGVEPLDELSLNAQWTPLCCRPPTRKPSGQSYRVGSSTMPHQSLQVGDVYDITRPFHSRWIEYLYVKDDMREAAANDTMIFSAGLHQLHVWL